MLVLPFVYIHMCLHKYYRLLKDVNFNQEFFFNVNIVIYTDSVFFFFYQGNNFRTFFCDYTDAFLNFIWYYISLYFIVSVPSTWINQSLLLLLWWRWRSSNQTISIAVRDYEYNIFWIPWSTLLSYLRILPSKWSIKINYIKCSILSIYQCIIRREKLLKLS